MDVDELLEELSSMDKGAPKPARSLQSLELEVLVEKDRRERCLLATCQVENRQRKKQQEEMKRNNEIRDFLAKAPTQCTAQPTSHGKNHERLRDQEVWRYVADVEGMPLSVTSAVTGDRVYCSQKPEGKVGIEIDVDEATSVPISLDEIQQKIEQAVISTPPREEDCVRRSDILA